MKNININNRMIKSFHSHQNDIIRGARSNIMWIPIEDCWSYRWLFENVKSFRKWVYLSENCKKRRVRDKYMNKISKEMIWLEKQIKKQGGN